MSPAPAPTSTSVVAWRALMEAHERVMAGLRPALERHGLSVSEFDVLANLAPRETCRHAELADRVVLSRSALTRLVDRLVARGLLSRCPDALDGRGVRIRLTDEGAQVRRAALAANGRVVRAAFHGLTDGEVETLRSLAVQVAPQPSTDLGS